MTSRRSDLSAVSPSAAPTDAPAVWRVAVLADTHDRYPPTLPARLAEADEIWHLGDVCDPVTLADFEALGKPLTVVQGNNDVPGTWPEWLRLERNGREFHLEHIAPRRAPPGAQFVLSGHTHVPSRHFDEQGIGWLNPGCITRPRAEIRSFAWLKISSAGEVEWVFEPL
jgi:uncharacterized protein